jgi:hypothetical protein
MEKMMTVSWGTAPSTGCPRVRANFWNDLGTFIVCGWMKVKKRTLAPLCWKSYSRGSQSALDSNPLWSSSARRT